MEIYKAKEIAKMLKVSEQTVRRYGRKGLLETVRMGRTVRYVMPETKGVANVK